MVRKLGGADNGKLYAMKVLKKATIVTKTKTTGIIFTHCVSILYRPEYRLCNIVCEYTL